MIAQNTKWYCMRPLKSVHYNVQAITAETTIENEPDL